MRLLAAFLLLWFLSACSPTLVADTWKSDVQPKPKSILVVAVFPPEERSFAENFENHMADDLMCLGYAAYTPHNFNGKLIDLENREKTLARLKAEHIDAVLTITLLDWKTEKKTMPVDLWRSPYNHYNCELLCYLSAVGAKNLAGYDPGRRYIWESNLYDAGDLNLLYGLRTKAAKPEKAKHNAYDCSHTIISDMVWQHVLAGKALH